MREPVSDPVRHHFRSDLSETPLPEVLLTIHRYRAPGAIECSREGTQKTIYIDGGNIVFATSNERGDSLGDRLLSSGRITPAQYEESVRLLQTSTKRQGTILVEMGALQPKELFVSVREQVQAIVWSVFDWREGSVSFDPGRDRQGEFIKLNIPTRMAVLQGVRAMADVRSLIARVGTKTTVLEKNKNADFHDLTLGENEQRVLKEVDGKKTLFELTNLTIDSPPQNARTIYALFALGVIQVRPAKQIKVQVRTLPPGES